MFHFKLRLFFRGNTTNSTYMEAIKIIECKEIDSYVKLNYSANVYLSLLECILLQSYVMVCSIDNEAKSLPICKEF